jgi:hypothetical protein
MKQSTPNVTKRIRQQHAEKIRELKKMNLPREKLKTSLEALRRVRKSIGASNNESKRSSNQ